MTTLGLHHVTAITGDIQANVDFYAGVLGLRLVKVTVNHNDAQTLHVFYGDADGSPGSLLSFFVWPGGSRGRRGAGQTGEVGLTVPREHISDWMGRLLDHGIAYTGPQSLGDTSRLSLTDPDGLPIVLVGLPSAPATHPWSGSRVPAAMQCRGLHHVTLWSDVAVATRATLARQLGYGLDSDEGGALRPLGDGVATQAIAVRDVQGFWPGADGVGVVHHVAFRAPDVDGLRLSLARVEAAGLELSPVREHHYFQSLYFREPGGCLIELATDRPGLTLDEPVDTLGGRLTLPVDWEPRRKEIESTMPEFTQPGAAPRRSVDLGWIHRFERDAGPLTLLLLHGTGADETQLLDIGRRIAPGAHRLGVRGRSLEEGAPRFFRRFSATSYDQAHLLAEAEALTVFLREAASVHGFAAESVVAVGYSNGANIALTALSHWPSTFAGAVLLRPVMVMDTTPDLALDGLPVLVLEGRRDPFLPYGEAVVPYLRRQGAAVQVQRLDAGHELTPTDVALAADWVRDAVPRP